MAVTPREAMGRKEGEERKQIYAIELEINRKLKQQYNGRKPVNIELPKCSKYVRDSVLRIFAEAGWEIGCTSHQGETVYHFESAE